MTRVRKMMRKKLTENALKTYTDNVTKKYCLETI